MLREGIWEGKLRLLKMKVNKRDKETTKVIGKYFDLWIDSNCKGKTGGVMKWSQKQK